MDLNIESVRKFFLAESNLEMAGNVLRNDHLLRLILVHEGHEVVPLLVRDDDLVPLVLLQPHAGQSVLPDKVNSPVLFRLRHPAVFFYLGKGSVHYHMYLRI